MCPAAQDCVQHPGCECCEVCSICNPLMLPDTFSRWQYAAGANCLFALHLLHLSNLQSVPTLSQLGLCDHSASPPVHCLHSILSAPATRVHERGRPPPMFACVSSQHCLYGQQGQLWALADAVALWVQRRVAP